MPERKTLLFVIHDLGCGGAEKALIRLVRGLDRTRFDISVTALFGGGALESSLPEDVSYRTVFPRMLPGNSHWMKLLSPEQLHRLCVKGRYDVEISFLEGPCARVVSGCRDRNTRLVSWIHVEHRTRKALASPFRSLSEARNCYGRFHQTVCVSRAVARDFRELTQLKTPWAVLYNPVHGEEIRSGAAEPAPALPEDGRIRLIALGTLKAVKGQDRLLNILRRLREEKLPVRLYLAGDGPLRPRLERYIRRNAMEADAVLLGHLDNPYPLLSRCDLMVSASSREGYSTAVTEALVLGIPVCAVETAGMEELLGGRFSCGRMTEDCDEALYLALKSLLTDPAQLARSREEAKARGAALAARDGVRDAERMLLAL